MRSVSSSAKCGRPTNLLVAATLWSASAVSFAATGCQPLPGTITPNVQWPQVWQRLNQQSNCTDNCHLGTVPAGGLNLSSSQLSIFFLVEQFSSQFSSVPMVVPGDPKASLFFQKVNCTSPDVGGRMPPGGGMPADLQALIYDWIARGAYGEGPEDPIARDFIFRDGTESQR
jgi:hypothetical protein